MPVRAVFTYNVADASDPVNLYQVRRRIKVEKAFRGGSFCVGDCYQVPEDEWEEIVDFLEREQLVCRASGGGWVLCRDLEHYSLHRLLGHSPWPLPRPTQLPEQLDEAWYPALRRALDMLHEEQAALFDGSLAQWLRARE